MKRTCLFALVLMLFACFSANAQIKDMPVYPLDSIAPGAIRGEVGYMMSGSYSENNDYLDFTSLLTLKGKYMIPSGTDFIFSGRQFFERDDGGAYVNKNYAVLAASINKYKILENGNCQIRSLYFQPFVSIRNNSDRGLRYRAQLGLLVHPLTMYTKNTKFNVGAGLTLNRQSWRMVDNSDSDYTDLEASDPKKWEKINFVAEEMADSKGHFANTDVKALLFFNSQSTFNEKIHLDVTLLYEQAFSTPYEDVVTDVYSDLKTPYPSVIADINLKVDLTRKLAANVKMTFDWEKTTMSLYSARHDSYFLVGLSYRLDGKTSKGKISIER